MSLVGFRAQAHPQQTKKGERDFVDDRAVPPEEFAKLQERFRFTVDVAAAPHNAKLPRFYTRKDSGLEVSWAGERVYCNPPYSEIGRWVVKAWAESKDAELIVMLLPANRTEQAWWQDLVECRRDRPGEPLRVEFLKGRLRFIATGMTKVEPNMRPPFGCCLLIWERPAI